MYIFPILIYCYNAYLYDKSNLVDHWYVSGILSMNKKWALRIKRPRSEEL